MAVFKMLLLVVIGCGGGMAQMWSIWAGRPEVFLMVLAVNTAALFLCYDGISRRLLATNTVAQATFGVAAALIGGWQGIAALFIAGGLITLATWKSAISAEAL